jgi:large subunit ribosomal protein L15
MRGQNSRSGGGVRLGFEGGQTPLYRRLPKIVHPRTHQKKVYELIKIEMLNCFSPHSCVSISNLLERKILTKPNKGRYLYKVVGGAELTVPGLTVSAHAFTKAAKEAIETSGGKPLQLSERRIHN